MTVTVASVIESLLGNDLPVRFEAYDGSTTGPAEAATTVVVRSPDVVNRLLTAPGELGLARAYVAGELEVQGEIWGLFDLTSRFDGMRIRPQLIRDCLALLGGPGGVRRLPPPPEEHVTGVLSKLTFAHTKHRDADAISHHYDVGNDFYRLVLGPSMTYSCAVFEQPDTTLEDAQAAKYELISRKLGLQPGMRLLDIGCGWGGMVLHAARHHGVEAVGVTISRAQADKAEKRIAEAGLTDRIEIRLEDYRDIHDGPYDGISSIGMFEHVGLKQLNAYFLRCRDLLRPGGRLLNHAISRNSPSHRPSFARRSFIQRYVFPDGELHEVGTVVSGIQGTGLEVRDVEGLREHYALTLRRWVANLEDHWDEAVRLVGEGRARVWRLYMAGSATGFESGRIHVDQVLAVRDHTDGTSDVPLRRDW